MAALAGDHIKVIMAYDPAGGSSPTTYNIPDGDITMVDLGLTYTQHDVTGFGDDVKRFINGQLQAPVTIKGYLSTETANSTHNVIEPAFANGYPVTLTVQVGDNADPTNGDPEYSGDFVIESYKPTIENGGAIMFTATLKPATGTAPSWGVVPAV